MSKVRARESSIGELMRAHKAVIPGAENLDTQDVERLDSGPPEHLSTASAAKSKDVNYMKLTAYVPRDLHAKLKAKAALQRREISEIIIELAETYVQERRP